MIFISLIIVGSLSNLFSIDQEKILPNINDNLILDTSVGNLIDDWYEIWEGEFNDYAYDCAVDSLNNLYVVGFTEITSGNRDIVLIKFNQDGQQLWNQTWGGDLEDSSRNLFIKSPNEIYVGGTTRSFGDPDGDAVVIQYNSSGHQQWNFTWGSDQDEDLQGIAVDSLGNIYIGGQTGYLDSTGDIYLAKFNSAREEQWNITYGNSGYQDRVTEIEVDKYDYVYVASGTETDGSIGDESIVTFKYNSSGDLEWKRIWSTGADGVGCDLAFDSLNNVYVAGYYFSPNSHGCIIKYDEDGNYQWDDSFYQTGEGNFWYAIAIDSNDEIYVGGRTTSHGVSSGVDCIFFNYDISGNQNWYKAWGDTGDEDYHCLVCDDLDNLYCVGWTDSYDAAMQNILIVKYEKNVSIDFITPENTTYFEPMSGYYSGTFGFENDELGNNEPNSWANTDIIGTESSIISEEFGHYNVIHQDTGPNNQSLAIGSNDKCLTLTGDYDSWSANADKQITYSSDIISVEGYMMAGPWSGSSGPHPTLARIGFINPTIIAWGQYYAGISFSNNNGDIYFFGGTSSLIFGTYEPYSWYHVKTVVNITDNSAKAYLNGEFMAETPLANDASEITHVVLMNGHTSVTSYFDKIICSQGVTEQVIFEEDFDSYTVGTFPSSFYLRYNGLGDGYQVVTDAYAVPESQASVWHDITLQAYGTVELYMGHEGFQSELANLNIMFSNGTSDAFGLQMRFDGKWTYWDGCWQPLGFGNHEDGIFYQVSISFRCSSSTSYEGLVDPFTWKVSINGIEYGEFSMYGVWDVDRITLFTSGAGLNDHGYWDAIGYSWDPYYCIGDNLNEGILLSFENNTVLDWMGYSLDGNPNITIQGNTTIPMPIDGPHWIQVSGNSTSGIYYQSEVRYFTVKNDSISIITPGDTTYTGPMSGYYPATYGFENDAVGTDPPAGWNEAHTGGYGTVLDDWMGHSHPFRLTDTSNGYRAEILQNIEAGNQTSGTIELYMASGPMSQIYDGFGAFFYDNGAEIFAVSIDYDDGTGGARFIINHDAGSGPVVSKIDDANLNQWYRVSIDFECGTGGYNPRGHGSLAQYTYRIYIDDVNYGEFTFYYPGTDGLDKIRLFTWAAAGAYSDYNAYVDAIGYSWDPNYYIGDNLNEGILLSFESDTVLDWMGYSLDGNDYITIQGNTTIPMPTGNGHHGIQVSGNNTSGIYYYSEIKNFTLEWEYTCLRPVFNHIDMINEFGLEFNITMNAIGFLDVQRQTFIFPNLPHVDHNPLASYFYNIKLQDAHFREDPSIFLSITIRFYYDPSVIADPGNLHLYHYVSSEGRWREEDFILNTVENYVEFTTTELSYFCLAEPGSFIFPIPPLIIILIIILSAVGISVPSAYVFFSKRKKKSEGSSKIIRTRKVMIKRTEIIPLEETRQKIVREVPITPEMLTPIKSHRSKKSLEVEHLKKAVKVKEEEITIVDEEYKKKIIEETERTEREIIIEKESDFCIVHKGPITGIIYVCPKCKAKYCLNCATTLSQEDENCWVCDMPIKIDKIRDEKRISVIKVQKRKPLDNHRLKKIFSDKNVLNAIDRESEITISILSEEFLEKINQFEWDENEKLEFIREMLALPPIKREKIVNRMIEMSNYKGE